MSTNTMLLVALGITAVVIFSLVRRVFKLAMYAAVVGALAWLWYFVLRG